MNQYAGRFVAFLALFVLPLAVTTGGVAFHLEKSKSTQFCLSCHEMTPYAEGLSATGDQETLSSSHYLDRTIPRDQACYTCHTTYAMFGDLKAKRAGAQHLLVHVLGRVPEEFELYEPYRNRECLHCHEEARSYDRVALHERLGDRLQSSETSCLECHGPAHRVRMTGNP